MPGRFGTAVTVTGGPVGSFVITPSASPLPEPIRQITINGSGAVTWTSSIDGTTNVTNILPAGTYPMFASHILSATTATVITGWV